MKTPETRTTIDATAQLLRALGNSHRLLILCRLFQDDEVSAGELAQQLDLAASTLSQHLHVLRDRQLIDHRRAAQMVYYRLAPATRRRFGILLGNLCDVAGVSASSATQQSALDVALAPLTAVANADQWQYPVIRSAGGVMTVPDGRYAPNTRMAHKWVASLNRAPPRLDGMHPGLVRAARLINLYADRSTARTDMLMTLVIAGDAMPVLLNPIAHREQFAVDNANATLLAELMQHGVTVAACGQSLAAGGYRQTWLLRHVTIAVSALSVLVELQQNGHVLMPL